MKRVLFICPGFFGYDIEIKNSLIKKGYDVTHLNDHPSNSPIFKAAVRLFRRALEPYLNFSFKRKISSLDKNFDIVFVIKGEYLTDKTILFMRNIYPNAKFVYYAWDSIKNTTYALNYIKIFDSAYTFDPEDVKRISNVKHLPLFYLNEYSKLEKEKAVYDVTFMGTGHKDRYLIVSKFIKLNPCRFYKFIYLQSVLLFYFRKFFDRSFKNASLSEFDFVPLSKIDMMKVLAKTTAMLDIQHKYQTGLTMRTLECLGAQVKLITTNSSILNYDFYHPDNIYIVDRDNPVIDPHFLNTPYKKLSDEIYNKYSINHWLEELLPR